MLYDVHEECGIFGIFGNNEASALTVLGLHALQHRGQESVGVACVNETGYSFHKKLGLVNDVFNPKKIRKLDGYAAIGHVRYSTTGDSSDRNIQPIITELYDGVLAVSHNGNLTNTCLLKDALLKDGCIFQTSTDTEIINHLVARSKKANIEEKLFDALKQVTGAYSLLVLTKNCMIGVRDPNGVRPLVLGVFNGSYILASETCALDIIGAEYIRDIEPGEAIVITKDNIESYFPFARVQEKFCIFEFIYFSRPDSTFKNKNVYEIRKKIGRQLALESYVDADMVVAVPDSGIPSALGFAEESKIPFDFGIIRNHYIGRTFIQPTDSIRDLSVKMKHNPNKKSIEGKRIILVDDSIVRGTTSLKIVKMIKDAGAKEVHLRISSPPTISPCYYGIDTPEANKLLAHNMSVIEMADYIGVDSLSFISLEGLYKAVNGNKNNYCDACFTNKYPIRLTDKGE